MNPKNTKRTWLRNGILLGVLSLLLIFVACNMNQSPTDGQTVQSATHVLDKVKASGKLKAGYIVYPPFVIKDPNSGHLSGYFIELMDAIAKEGAFSIDYEETNWGNMVTGLQTGKFDVVVSGIFATIPRAKEVTFTTPVLYVGISAIARKNDNRFTTVTDLAKKGLTIAVTNGEVGHEYAKKELLDAKLTVINTEDISRPMLEVVAGRADVALGDSMTAYRFAKQHPEVRNVFANNPFFVFGTSLMVRQNDPEWANFLNTSIEHMELSGVTDKLEAKYKEGSSAWISKRKPW